MCARHRRGLVVLKRVDEALRDGDNIYAVIKGFAVNNDGSEKISYTAPSVDAQARAIAQAQRLAGLTPQDITYGSPRYRYAFGRSG
ncbi:hypothetical protein DMI69_11655 [Escherichia coli]|nr:hypothetical protein [Escherichia coli]